MPPPFAVRYDETGRLITGSDITADAPGGSVDPAWCFTTTIMMATIPSTPIASFGGYDSNPNPANPNYWKRTYTPAWGATEEKYELPFGTLVSVPGVRIVQAGEDPAAPDTNYIDLFFSRYSGTPSVINRTP